MIIHFSCIAYRTDAMYSKRGLSCLRCDIIIFYRKRFKCSFIFRALQVYLWKNSLLILFHLLGLGELTNKQITDRWPFWQLLTDDNWRHFAFFALCWISFFNWTKLSRLTREIPFSMKTNVQSLLVTLFNLFVYCMLCPFVNVL